MSVTPRVPVGPKVSVLNPAARTKAGKHLSFDVIGEAPMEPSLLTTEGWCPALFSEPRRALKGFISASVIGLDVDDGLPLSQAITLLGTYRHIVGTTNSHQLPKGEAPPCDRYRIVLFLDRPASSPEEYKASLRQAAESLGIPTDTNAMDAARWFIPCREIVSTNLEPDSLLIPVQPASPLTKPASQPASKAGNAASGPSSLKGKLSRATLAFLAQDDTGEGWHLRFLKAAMDLKEQGYTEDEAAQRLTTASPVFELDATDMQQLADVYANRGGALAFRDAWPQKNKDGKPLPLSIANQRYLLSEVLGFSFFYNSRREVVYYSHRDEPTKRTLLTNLFYAQVNTAAREQGLSAGESLKELIATMAGANAYDPILDPLEGLEWDGGSHIAQLFETISQPAGTPPEARSWHALFLRRWLIGVVTKVYCPGSENNVLVFQGQQAAGKSRWLKRLAQLWPEGFGEGHVSPENKDHELRHLDNFMWHVAEFDSTTSRREVGALKDYFTKDVVNTRRPYGHLPITGRSICSFCASVNSHDFLHDATGNRRYLVIPVVSLDANHEVNIEQVFAEAKAAMLAGERQWFDRTEIEEVNSLNANFLSKEEYLEVLEERAQPGDEALTISEIMERIGFDDIQLTRPIRSNIRTTLERQGIPLQRARGVTRFLLNSQALKDAPKPHVAIVAKRV
jgi:hypothetical protein